MRDGIYKNLSLPRGWRTALRCYERPAERDETSTRAFEKALEADARSEISPEFIKNLRCVIVKSGELSLLGATSLSGIQSSREIGGRNTALENTVLSSARRFERRGIRGRALIVNSTSEALREWRERRYRQIEEHYLIEARSEARDFLSHLRDAMDEVDLERMAERIAKGDRRRPVRLRGPIKIDQDDLTLLA